MPHAYHGRFLDIDAESGSAELRAIDEADLRHFVGGVGLGSWLWANQTPPRIDPLDPEARLVFAFSPLVGTPMTTSAKFAVVSLSPLTGRICDALSSSHFALAGKGTGADAFVIHGACTDLSILFIDGSTQDHSGHPMVTWKSASHLAGRSAAETETEIRITHDAGWQVAAIGPAGERRIPFATISHDGRHAGRGGLGAVLGSKKIKAIAVRGNQRVTLADPAETMKLARQLSARSTGPETAKYRELGTIANLLVFNRFQSLPTRNFRTSRFENAEQLAAVDLAPARRITRKSCAACTIGCEHIFERPGKGGARLEYESLYALGPLCGIDDPETVVEAAALCDEFGLDTISTGATIAWAFDCIERGLLRFPEIEAHVPLRFGSRKGLLRAIRDTAHQAGALGELLALGSRRAAEQIGGEAPMLAMHVKGLELPGYDPRVLPSMALGLAVAARGADHNRTSAYDADFSPAGLQLRSDHQIAMDAIDSENRAALLDSLILCKFLRKVFCHFETEAAGLLHSVTGWDVDPQELQNTAYRIVTARRCINLREGGHRGEDTLPARLLNSSSESGPRANGFVLSQDKLDAMVAAYYRNRGWDFEGNPTQELLERLSLNTPAFRFHPS